MWEMGSRGGAVGVSRSHVEFKLPRLDRDAEP
jgi:hypothetical protein